MSGKRGDVAGINSSLLFQNHQKPFLPAFILKTGKIENPCPTGTFQNHHHYSSSGLKEEKKNN
jgi:hypothetical protein